MRFRCVCKYWNALISNPKFIKIHQKRSERNKHTVLIEKTYPFDASECLVVKYLPVHGLVKDQLINPCGIMFEECRDDIAIVGSCNGLLCLFGFNQLDIWFYFYNPATRTVSKKLGTSTNTYGYMFGFGYDSLTDTYKVVNVCQKNREVRVFSLGDNIWKDIPSFPDVHFPWVFVCYSCVYLSGTLNWLVIRNDITYDWNNRTVENFAIISLDLGTETYRQLLPPRGSNEVLLVEAVFICVFMDCLCMCYSHAENFVIWKMMKFGVEESWSQFLKIDYHNLRRDCFNAKLSPFCLFESGDTLIMGDRNGRDPIIHNRRTNMVVPTTITVGKRWLYFNNYVESLVSTDGK